MISTPVVPRVWAAVCAAALLMASGIAAGEAPSAEQLQIQALQTQLDALTQILDRISTAEDPAVPQQAMTQHWSGLQDHLRSIGQLRNMGDDGYMDWMMMDPSVMWPGHLMAGKCMGGHDQAMMSQGRSGWAVPANITAQGYQQHMQKHMQTMRTHLAAIAQEGDSARRQERLGVYYQSLYRDMQAIRGMGWMIERAVAASLPERGSYGAGLATKYCSQCHATPSPSIHTQAEWSAVAETMCSRMEKEKDQAGAGVSVPSKVELDAIVDYMKRHARAN